MGGRQEVIGTDESGTAVMSIGLNPNRRRPGKGTVGCLEAPDHSGPRRLSGISGRRVNESSAAFASNREEKEIGKKYCNV